MARTGMATLITNVRSLAAAGTADYSIAGTTYWTDDQLQSKLDRHSLRVVREAMQVEAEWRGAGSAVYYDYYFRYQYVEEATSGTTIWSVQNSAGSAFGTADYSVNYEQRKVTFTTDQDGEERYLTYTAYDPFRAAAEVMDDKAAHVADRYDVASDNHDLKRSQMFQMYSKRAADLRRRSPYPASMGRAGQSLLVRSDMP